MEGTLTPENTLHGDLRFEVYSKKEVDGYFIEIYRALVDAAALTIEDVPEKWRDAVSELLEE